MFSQIGIRARLSAGFAAILLLIIALTAISISQISAVNTNLTIVNDVNSVKQRYAINFRGSVHNRAIALRDMILVQSANEREGVLQEIRDLTDQYTASAGPLDAMLKAEKAPTAEEATILASIKQTESKTLPLIEEVVRRRAAGDETGAAAVLMQQARPAFVEWLARINQFIDFEEAANKTLAGTTRQATESFGRLLMEVCGVAVLLGGLIAWWSVNSIRPLSAMAAIMGRLEEGEGEITIPCAGKPHELGKLADAMAAFRRKLKGLQAASLQAEQARAQQVELILSSIGDGLVALSQGDLTARVNADLGAYGQLKTDFNEALASLGGTISAVTTGADAIRTGSMEIAQASEDLARRTESNAASLEETSAALVQIDGRLKASVTASAQTVSRADQAIATVDNGRAMAGEAVAAMDRVRDSAKGIDDVIEGLDKIAFQTRVLAMNAAVEAGRAGDAGRGFAVVADLVSALAMRAEEEAKRARDQLTVTQTEVVSAVDRVRQVDTALSAISGDVGEVHALLRSMASDNAAQATGIGQITVAIGTMDQSTQQNAAMVEETSAAARNLTIEVNDLSARTAVFNTGNAVRKIRIDPTEPPRHGKSARAVAPPKSDRQMAFSGAGAVSTDDAWMSF